MARRHSRKSRNYLEERRNGYGNNLYRNTRCGKIGGVCAGLADHFGISHWVMRIIFIAAFVFTSGAVFWIYILCWIVLAPASAAADVEESYEYDENQHCYRRRNVFRYQAPTGERIKNARERLDEINRRVSVMEEYVTSRKFKLDQEFARL